MNLETTIQKIEVKISDFESPIDDQQRRDFQEQIDLLLMENECDQFQKKRLKELRSKLNIVKNPEEAGRNLSESEIFAYQKKMLYDCQNYNSSIVSEMERQNNTLRGVDSNLDKLTGKLTVSSGLIGTIKKNIYKNKLVFFVVLAVIFMVVVVLIMEKIWRMLS